MRRIGSSIPLLAACGGSAPAGSPIVLEARPTSTEVEIGQSFGIDIIVSWDDGQIGLLPGDDFEPGLKSYAFRLETGAGIRPVEVEFDPELAPNATVHGMDATGVAMTGFQSPPFANPMLDTSNPITIARVTCVGENVTENELEFHAYVLDDAVSIYRNSLGFGYDVGIGGAGLDIVTASVYVGGPCCEDACNEADLVEPFGVLDFTDVILFLTAFEQGSPFADLAEPAGVYDFSDVLVFLTAFGQGCP